jgi:hypothetical protein
MKRSLPLQLITIFCCLFFVFPVNSNAQSCTPVAVSKTNPIKVYVHYMPWFFAPQNPVAGTTYPLDVNATGSWGFHWTEDGSGGNPNTFTTITNYAGVSVQARNIDAHYHPLIGPYDGEDTSVLEYHLLLMKLSGIDGVMIDWYGLGGNGAGDAGANELNTNALIGRMGKVGLKYGLVMEDAAWKGMTAADSNGAYAVRNYFTDPNYIKLGDMRGSNAAYATAPLACVFGPQQFKTQGQWSTILQGNTKAFLPLYGQAAQIGTDAGGTFVWPYPQAGQSGTPPAWYVNTSSYYTGSYYTGGAPNLHNNFKEGTTTLGNNVVLGTAYQGFFDFYLSNAGSTTSDQDGIIPRNYGSSGNTLSTMLALYTQNKSVMDGIQLTTWNDFSEGTIIEPTVEFGFASLDTIQKFTGVSYTEHDLQEVYKLFTLRKQYYQSSSTQLLLNQVSCDFATLQVPAAETLLDCIAATGNACPATPSITSSATEDVLIGSSFNYQITASNGPIIRYGASNLPAGLSINTATGVISGSPTTIGTYTVTDSATNSVGTGNATLVITVSGACPNAVNSFVATLPASANTYQWQVNAGSGYTNITNNTLYAGATTDTLLINDPSTSMYGYLYKCAITNNNVVTYSTADTLLFVQTWTGATDTAWEKPANWGCGVIPDGNTDVIINPGLINYPVINSNAQCKSINVNPATTIKVNSGFSLNITGKSQ